MKIVFFGLSLASSWGNGHAVTYRSLIKGLHETGHQIVFFERDVNWYRVTRDFNHWPFCQLVFYERLSDLAYYRDILADNDVIIIGSYVPDAGILYRMMREFSKKLLALYDIDTPVTIADLRAGRTNVFDRSMIADCDLYLSFTGGPLLKAITQEFNARYVFPLYCSVDPNLHVFERHEKLFALSYLGTYSIDRQRKLQELLFIPAAHMSAASFIVAGAQYPRDVDWPKNVLHVDHIAPNDHSGFYQTSRATLNLTRSDMEKVGYSPSIRLFEAASCGTPILTDEWPGLSDFFTPGEECLVVHDHEDVLRALSRPEQDLQAIAQAARSRTLQFHSGAVRASELIDAIGAAQEPSSEALKPVEPIARLHVE